MLIFLKLIMFCYLIFIFRVASSSKCNMDYNCLAIVFGPTIVGVTSTSLDDLHIKFELISKVSNQVCHYFFKIEIIDKTETNNC